MNLPETISKVRSLSRSRVAGASRISPLLALFLPLVAMAQEEGPRDVDIPNPMAIHTWFIIVAVGAFLAWCISYVLDLHKERAKPRETLLQQKGQLLDRIAELESKKEAGTIPQSRYEKEYRKARGRLSEVVSRLNQTPTEK